MQSSSPSSSLLSSFPPAPPEITTLESELKPEVTTKPPSLSSPPDFIPRVLPSRQVHLFSGASGAGKTALTFSLLASMHQDKPFFDMPIRKPAFIGYLAADRTWDDHEIWLATVGLSSLPYYSLIDDPSINGKAIRGKKVGDRFDLFRRCVAGILINSGLAPAGSSPDDALKSLPWDSFIIVDPISLFLGGDLNRYDTVYSHMLDLNQFCLRYSCTLLGIAHAGKQKADSAQRYTRAQDRIVGTTAQTGCAGTTMHLSPPSETGQDWSEWTLVPHHAAAQTLKLTRDSNGLFIPNSPAVATTEETEVEVQNLSIPSRIIPYFPKDFSLVHAATLVASAAPLSQSQVYRYLQKLELAGEVERIAGKPGYWKLRKKD